MQWIFTVCSCLEIFFKFIECHPTVHTFLTKPVEWDKSQPQLVYPQLHSADSPRITSSSADSPSVLVLRTSAETFYIELTPNEHLLKSNASIASKTKPVKSCHYQGKILSHTGGMAAISICESNKGMTGTIMVRNEAFILRPLHHLEDADKYQHLKNASLLEEDPHVINRVEHPLPYCGMDHNAIDIQFEENEIDGNRRFRRSTEDHKVIETAVYVDHPLYRKFILERMQTEEQLRDAVLAIINQVQIIYNYQSLKIKFKVVVVKLEFLTEEKEAPDPAEGDIDSYLDNFCSWQSKMNPPEPSLHHWDHAIMLSGYDLHKMTEGKKNGKVLGLAWVNGMCRPKHSCTLNEGSSFEAAFVIAHEMGHSLGMMHDGRGNDCDPTAHLMAEKTGPGRITWSSCSNDYLQKFFEKGRGKCLEDDDTNDVETTGRYKLDDQLPGHRFDLLDQCQLSLGLGYRPHVIPKIPFNNVCRELWCVSGLWASVAHPALEGSSCGVEKQCVQGKCKNNLPSLMEHEFTPSAKFPDVQVMLADFMEKLKLAFSFILP